MTTLLSRFTETNYTLVRGQLQGVASLLRAKRNKGGKGMPKRTSDMGKQTGSETDLISRQSFSLMATVAIYSKGLQSVRLFGVKSLR